MNQAGRLVVVSGVSGAGKTLALQTLEDIGYFCIDNLPPSMLESLRERVQSGQRVAVVVDTRAGEPLEHAEETLLQMRADALPVEILFLDCADEVLIRRFKETRRPHPLANIEPSLPKALRKERELLAPLKAIADQTLDTTLFRPQDLREAVRGLYGEAQAHASLRVRVVSFGFKHGVPADVDLVFDVRFLRNPHYVPNLKPKPGTDPAVREYVLGDAETQEFLETMRNFLAYLLPRYEREGKAYLTVGIGCTGGRHRSVVLGEQLGAWFIAQGYRATVEHRDLARGET
ncbi:MAG: nucleotide-binding protein [Fimbriimonadales bacterium]|nr:MAG: nucleotide-binding protein [Fimbriimonadales bacterium]